MAKLILKDDAGHFRKPESIVELDSVKILEYFSLQKFFVQKNKIFLNLSISQRRISLSLRFLRKKGLVGMVRSNKKYYWGLR